MNLLHHKAKLAGNVSAIRAHHSLDSHLRRADVEHAHRTDWCSPSVIVLDELAETVTYDGPDDGLTTGMIVAALLICGGLSICLALYVGHEVWLVVTSAPKASAVLAVLGGCVWGWLRAFPKGGRR